jgi:hypothetical protein
MTGGGRGFCNPRGVGRGYGVGWRGSYPRFGWGQRFDVPYYQPASKEEELDSLKNDAEEIKGQLEQIENRIRELEK